MLMNVTPKNPCVNRNVSILKADSAVNVDFFLMMLFYTNFYLIDTVQMLMNVTPRSLSVNRNVSTQKVDSAVNVDLDLH